MGNPKSTLYQEEFDFIFSKKGLCVRGVLVTSALVERQVFLLAKSFLEELNVKHEPRQHQEYRQSLNVLDANGVLNSKELKNIEIFWKERNRAIHAPFKEIARADWNEQNNKAVKLGRIVIKNLDKKLYP